MGAKTFNRDCLKAFARYCVPTWVRGDLRTRAERAHHATMDLPLARGVERMNRKREE